MPEPARGQAGRAGLKTSWEPLNEKKGEGQQGWGRRPSGAPTHGQDNGSGHRDGDWADWQEWRGNINGSTTTSPGMKEEALYCPGKGNTQGTREWTWVVHPSILRPGETPRE